MLKKLLLGLGSAVLVSSIPACGSLNSSIDEHIEIVGMELTDVPVGVEQVKIRLGGGSGQITGLTVANPDGYEAVNAFEIDLLPLNIGLLALLGGSSLVLDELVIDSPILYLEKNQNGGSNLKVLSDKVEDNI